LRQKNEDNPNSLTPALNLRPYILPVSLTSNLEPSTVHPPTLSLEPNPINTLRNLQNAQTMPTERNYHNLLELNTFTNRENLSKTFEKPNFCHQTGTLECWSNGRLKDWNILFTPNPLSLRPVVSSRPLFHSSNLSSPLSILSLIPSFQSSILFCSFHYSMIPWFHYSNLFTLSSSSIASATTSGRVPYVSFHSHGRTHTHTCSSHRIRNTGN
jgi:hypothetical protein